MTEWLSRFSIPSFLLGGILGVVLTQLWNAPSAPTFPSVSAQQHPTTATTSTKTPPTASQSSAVSVADQPAGNSVTVESVTVPPPGVWVAVREVDGSALGNILGAARVGGPRSNISIPLLRNTDPNTRYAIELYRDDGTDVFKASDSVYVDFNTGEPVVVFFNTTQ